MNMTRQVSRLEHHTSSLEESRHDARAGGHVQDLGCARHPELEELLGDVLDPAELARAAGPRVLLERDQLVLDLLRGQTRHPASGGVL